MKFNKEKITDTFLKELCKEQNIKEAFIREGIVEDLEIGNWYKKEDSPLNIIFIKSIIDNDLECFGFDYSNEWMDISFRNNSGGYITATESEVFEALKNECKNKFPIGTLIEAINNKQNLYLLSYDNIIFKDNIISVAGFELFNNGTWAEIIKEETYIKIPLSEITKITNDAELGRLVRNIADKY